MAITGINSSGYTSHYAANHTKTVKKAEKEAEEKAEKKRAEQKEKEEKLAEQRAKKTHQYSVKTEGTNVAEVTKKVVNSITSSELGIPLENSYSSFDVKA